MPTFEGNLSIVHYSRAALTMKIEPTGILFEAICDIQTEQCTARSAAPVTAVWSPPGPDTGECLSCLYEMVRRDEWQVEGARLVRHIDREE
jgi:hypothetical protein